MLFPLAVLPSLAALFLPLAAAGGCTNATLDFSLALTWSPRTDAAFPHTDSTGFTAIVCAVHSPNFSLFAPETLASPALVALASKRNSTPAIDAFKAGQAEGAVLDYQLLPRSGARASASSASSSAPIVPPVSSWNVSFNIDAPSDMRFLSCAAGIVPSPDFFVGITAFEACAADGQFLGSRPEGEKLRPWDAGIDSAESYEDASILAENPRDVLALLTFADRYGTYRLALDGAPAPEPFQPDDSACFPADEHLLLADGTNLPMHAVRIGHAARAHDAHSPVVLLSHADRTVVSTFVALTTASTTVRLSPGHYLPAASSPNAPFVLRTASSVAPGDYLSSPFGAVRVASVATTRAQGLYAPHTLAGTLVVSGIHVSCYTDAVHPSVAHAVVRAAAAAPGGAAALGAVVMSSLGRALGAWVRPLVGGPGAMG